jgi:two-component system NtrC family sensor kinase
MIALITAVACVVALRVPHEIEDEFREITTETLPITEIMGDMRFAVLMIVSSTSDLGLLSQADKERSAMDEAAEAERGEEGQLRYGIEMYYDALERFRKISETYPHEVTYFKKVRDAGAVFLKEGTMLSHAIKGGRPRAEVLRLKEKFERSERGLLSLIDEVMDSERQELVRRNGNVEAVLRSATRTLIIVSVMSFLLALVIAGATASSILRPLRRLREKIEQLGAGDLTVRVETDSRDEFGSLSRSFNKMADELSVAHQRIIKQGEFFRTVINSIDDAIAIIDVDSFEIVEVNSAFLKDTRLRRDEVKGRKCHEVIHESMKPCPFPCAVKDMVEQGRSVTVEHEHADDSGETRYLEVTASPVRDEDGNIVQAVYVARDVTSKVQFQKSIIESQRALVEDHNQLTRLYRELEITKKEWENTMNCVDDMIILTDSNGMIRRFNRAFEEFSAIGKDRLTGMSWEEAINANDLETRTFYQGSIELFHAPSKRWFAMNTYPYEDAEHDFSGTVVLIHETTEIKQISEELERTNKTVEQNRLKLQKALDEIFRLMDNATRSTSKGVRFHNPHIRKCYDVKDCKKTECPCYGREAMRCWQVAGTYCGGEVQGAFAQKYGSCVQCNVYQEATNDPIYQIGEQFNNMMHVLELKNRELENAYRELKASQSAVVQQEKMASIGQLAAGVAHEINNPMGFISSNLGTLGKYMKKLAEFMDAQAEVAELVDSDEVKEKLKETKKALKIDYILEDVEALIEESLEGAERVKKIVQNLKSFSRVDEAELKMADINECIESTLNIVWNELKYKAEVKKEYGDIPLTKCYPQQLNQVFMNLLVNSAQAIEKQGEIRIKTWNGDGKVKITIEDTGSGIPEDKLGRIFEPFFTTKPVGKGTGLGLSISYDIVKKHNGDIQVESEVGKGTKFTITIPVVEDG